MGRFCVIQISVGFQERFWAMLQVVVVLAVLEFVCKVPVLTYMWHNPLVTGVLFVLYLVGGVIWVFPKWYFFVRDHLYRFLEMRENYLQRNKLGAWKDEYLVGWKEYYDRMSHINRPEYKPKPRDHKEKIMTWMIGWPISLPWTMLNDPIHKFFLYVYHSITGVLQRISDNAFKGLEMENK